MALFRRNSEQPNNGRDPQASQPLPSSGVIPPPVQNGNGAHANGNGAHANGNGAAAPAQVNNSGAVVTNGGYTPPPEFRKVREEVQQYLVNEVKSVNDVGGPAKLRQMVEPVFNKAMENAHLVVSRVERSRLMDMLLADILGYGPIQPLLDRDDITEVMVNGPKQVYYEQKGKLILTDVKFIDDAHVLQIIDRIVAPLGRRIDESSPMVDARLPDGSRVNAIIPPLSLVGPCITIRKFRRDPYKMADLVRFNSLTAQTAEFIEACVRARLNIIVSGGTGSGKTTMLNVVSNFIPEDERIITVEDAAELQLQQPHVIRLEKRPPNMEGKGGIGIRDLVINCLRMRPERIVVGEVRSGEALDMLQAMNTGHDGSLTTVHSNSARDTLNRIETMVLMAGMDLPLRAIRQQVASAVDVIIHLSRMRDGSRRVVQVAEVLGMEGETILMQDIFTFEQSGVNEEGKIIGELRPSGLRPRCSDKIAEAGITLPGNLFGIDPKNLWK